MTDKLRNDVSGISETSGITGVGHFLAAIGWGTLAGTAAFSLWLVAVPISAFDMLDVVGFMLFVSFFVSLIAFAGMIAIGLPVTVILRAIGQEYAALYASIGAFAGCIAMAAIFQVSWILDPELVLLLVSGTIAGFACALRWGKWREQVGKSRNQKARQSGSGRRSNPIHDLTH